MSKEEKRTTGINIENIFKQIKESEKNKIMELKLYFTDEEMTSYLMHYGYNVETVRVYDNVTEYHNSVERHEFDKKIAYLDGEMPYEEGDDMYWSAALQESEYTKVFTQEIKEKLLNL